MAKKNHHFRPQIADSLRDKLKVKKEEDSYFGGLQSYVASILDRYIKGNLAVREVRDVTGVRDKRKDDDSEQRKVG